MAARKLQQEIDKCFKQVDIGVESFDSQYEKYEQSTNASQREKQVDTLKKECKKLQRLRDQIKTWAAGNDVKDKGPLQDKRELIETKMEAFKAVEKEMKTKAFSKEGLLVSAKMDPKERERDEMRTFLGDMVDALGQQIEAAEAETEQLQVQSKKKKDAEKAERVADLETRTERHKWHQNKLELLMRALANDAVEPEEVKAVEDDIRYYVENNQEVDFYEDDTIYNSINLEEDSERFGMNVDGDVGSAQENQSVQDEPAEPAPSVDSGKGRSKSDHAQAARRPSLHVKSPLPALATLHNLPAAAAATVSSVVSNMKPAPPPSKPPGETLKYASAAAAAAANDTAGIGIAPLPPPPSKSNATAPATVPAPEPSTFTTPHAIESAKTAATSTPAAAAAAAASATERHPASSQPVIQSRPASSQPSVGGPSPASSAAQLAQATARDQVPPLPQANGLGTKEPVRRVLSREPSQAQNHDRIVPYASPDTASSNTRSNGVHVSEVQEDESVYHLPASLQHLVDSYEDAKKSAPPPSSAEHQRLLEGSFTRRPDALDAEKPLYYKPTQPATFTPSHYPQEPSTIFENPALYSRVDHDALFYSFYYRQGTYQQYLAAKELKLNSWRFHKQYQTWFQRHEEPQQITEDFERGTYRFFDYESTWLNRRKGDFEFRYRFLEDDL